MQNRLILFPIVRNQWEYADSYTIHRKAKPISKKVIWSSSNPKIANVYGDSYCEVIYAAEYDFKEMSIAPHWYQNQFAPM